MSQNASWQKMTELEQFRAMCTRAGIVFTEGMMVSEGGRQIPHCVTVLQVLQGDSKKNLGYVFFFTELYWDKAGKLLAMGAWE